MDAKTETFLASLIIANHRIKRYQETDYIYDNNGLYVEKPREWLPSLVDQELQRLGHSAGSRGVAELASLIRQRTFVDHCIGVQPPFRLSTGISENAIIMTNGVLRILKDGTIQFSSSHDPDLFAVCGTDYDYTPAALCPRWREFVRWMAGDRKIAFLLQQFCAWVLVACCLKLERFLWLYGQGLNGKSTFLRVLRYVYGPGSTSAVGLDAFNGVNFKLAPTLWRLANFSMDADAAKLRSVAALNSYVSNDPLQMPRKFKSHPVIEPTTVLFIASNTPPVTKDQSDAWWRRVLPIDCRSKPAKAGPGLLDTLKMEAPGILNWALEVLPRLLARQAFRIPRSVRQEIEHRRVQVSSARQFLAEKVRAGGKDSCLTRDHVFGIFQNWCEAGGYEAEKLAVLRDEMERMFGSKYGRFRVSKWQGVKPWKGDYRDNRVYGWRGVEWQKEEKENLAELEYRHAAPDVLEIQQKCNELYQDKVLALAKSREVEDEVQKLTKQIERLEEDNTSLRDRLLGSRQKAKDDELVSPVVQAVDGDPFARFEPSEDAEADQVAELLDKLDEEQITG